MKSLKAQKHHLSNVDNQIEILEGNDYILFEDQLKKIELFPLRSTGIDIFQMNLGKMCNQICKHCHVDAGPDRKEIMTKEVMQQCLDIIAKYSIPTVDLTGGAPEMNPHFRWLVTELSKLDVHIIDRCNLTIINANRKYHDLPEFFVEHKVEVVSSLPHFTSARTDRQRGNGVFKRSIDALQKLNKVGYGMDESSLKLNLVYNPAGAFLPDNQAQLEQLFKKQLTRQFNISFNQLFVITNLPISRFLDYLVESGNYEEYMELLVDAFNPAAAMGVMCRNTLSIGWDGYLYDCDFNQMLNMKVDTKGTHISEFDYDALMQRDIVINEHCYGCTAGAGSSCGGQTT